MRERWSERMRVRGWRGVVLLAACLLALLPVACRRPAPPGEPQHTVPPAPAVKGVYFAPRNPAQPHLQPYPLSAWQAKGFTLVHRAQDLYAAVGPETEVIAFDAEVVGAVDVDWLRAQFAQHRVVVGINFNLRELEQLLADTPPWTWTQAWRPPTPEPMFAVRVRGQTCSGGGQERFSRFAPLDTFLRAMVLPHIQCAHT